MGYIEFKPHPLLRCYVDAYWVVTAEDDTATTHRVFPDGCIDLIVNLGDDFLTDSGEYTMKNDAVFMVGTMTRYKDTVRRPGSCLVGIRFKPLGFSAFFKFGSLHEITEKTVEFDKKLLPELHDYKNETFRRLDKFLYDRLSVRTQKLQAALSDIQNVRGVGSIDTIAKQNCFTSRQLERDFKQHLGISPKEYANFIRYQNAFRLITHQKDRANLLDIALEAGYYDHAHLANEIKKFSGLSPSQLKNVGFFQTS